MKKHAVFVAGKRFVLLSEDKEEYVKKIAQEVNEAISKITVQNPTLDSRACAILCALDQADDKYKEIFKNQRFADQAKEVMNQSEKHAKTIKEMKEEIKKLKELNEKQLHQIADKNVEIENLKNDLKAADNENKSIEKEKGNVEKEQEKIKKENQKLKADNEKLKKELETKEKKIQENKSKAPFQNPVAQPKSTEKSKNNKNQMSLFGNE